MTPPPPLTALSDLDLQLRSAGFAVLDAASLAHLSGVAPAQLLGFVVGKGLGVGVGVHIIRSPAGQDQLVLLGPVLGPQLV